MRGVNIVESLLRECRQRKDSYKSTAGVTAESSIESIGLDGRRLAIALIYQATEDARQNPYGRGDNERVGQDKERIIEVIAEAQWFLLDDDDEEYPCGFHWSCAILHLEWTFLRRKCLKLLRKEGVILPRRERYRLAALAGARRMRKSLKRTHQKRHPCAMEGCFRLTHDVYCHWCNPRESLERRDVPCTKCREPVEVPLTYVRRPYCYSCQLLCVRDSCLNKRRPGSRASVCRDHHRVERRIGKSGTKMGHLYYPKLGPEDHGDGCSLEKKT